MKYMLMLYDAPEIDPKLEEEEFPLWMEYTQKLKEAGALLGGEALEGTDTATTVRGKPGKGFDLIDGPFAETKEVLSGFFMIEAENLDEATKWASQAPHVGHGGTVEIRPILEMPDP
jgi:hypothetical protein